jgi:hypothetical protein
MNSPARLTLITLFTCSLTAATHAQTSGAGKVDLSFNTQSQPGYGPNWYVYSIAPLTNGQVIVAGGFSFFSPAPGGPLVKLNANGSPDSSFNPRLRIGSFTAGLYVKQVLSRPDGRFFIHGNFTTVNLIGGYTNLAVIDAGGNLDTNFVPTGLGTDITAARLAVTPDNKLLFNLYSNLVHRLGHDGPIHPPWPAWPARRMADSSSAPTSPFSPQPGPLFTNMIPTTYPTPHSLCRRLNLPAACQPVPFSCPMFNPTANRLSWATTRWSAASSGAASRG